MDNPKGQPHEWPQGYQQSQQQPVVQQQPAGKLEVTCITFISSHLIDRTIF